MAGVPRSLYERRTTPQKGLTRAGRVPIRDRGGLGAVFDPEDLARAGQRRRGIRRGPKYGPKGTVVPGLRPIYLGLGAKDPPGLR